MPKFAPPLLCSAFAQHWKRPATISVRLYRGFAMLCKDSKWIQRVQLRRRLVDRLRTLCFVFILKWCQVVVRYNLPEDWLVLDIQIRQNRKKNITKSKWNWRRCCCFWSCFWFYPRLYDSFARGSSRSSSSRMFIFKYFSFNFVSLDIQKLQLIFREVAVFG